MGADAVAGGPGRGARDARSPRWGCDAGRSGMKVIYKITYPNGKIYIGKDLIGSVTYFGSVDFRLVQSDFTPQQSRDFTVQKEILWQSETATDQEVNAKEVE